MANILIVDDEEAIARLIARTLQNAGYSCRAVTDSARAADLLEQNRCKAADARQRGARSLVERKAR